MDLKYVFQEFEFYQIETFISKLDSDNLYLFIPTNERISLNNDDIFNYHDMFFNNRIFPQFKEEKLLEIESFVKIVKKKFIESKEKKLSLDEFAINNMLLHMGSSNNFNIFIDEQIMILLLVFNKYIKNKSNKFQIKKIIFTSDLKNNTPQLVSENNLQKFSKDQNFFFYGLDKDYEFKSKIYIDHFCEYNVNDEIIMDIEKKYNIDCKLENNVVKIKKPLIDKNFFFNKIKNICFVLDFLKENIFSIEQEISDRKKKISKINNFLQNFDKVINTLKETKK